MTDRADIQKAQRWFEGNKPDAREDCTCVECEYARVIINTITAALTPQIDVEALKNEFPNELKCPEDVRQWEGWCMAIDFLASKGLISGVATNTKEMQDLLEIATRCHHENRAFAARHGSSHHHGAANAFEIMQGVIQEKINEAAKGD